MLIYLLNTLIFWTATLFLLFFVSGQMRIKFQIGAIPALGTLLTLLFAIPYAGWILATILLLRFTTVMTNAVFWPDSTALASVVIPILYLLKIILF